MPLDEIVSVVDAQMPIRAKRIKYFDDPALQGDPCGAGRGVAVSGAGGRGVAGHSAAECARDADDTAVERTRWI